MHKNKQIHNGINIHKASFYKNTYKKKRFTKNEIRLSISLLGGLTTLDGLFFRSGNTTRVGPFSFGSP